jgi:gamma-glutamylcyclotransferase (GGCT)/AIG2-like uncharacterized protein YtfP
MPLLFSYGTLQQTPVQWQTFGRSLPGARDALVGYQSSRVAIDDPAIASSLGRTHHDNAIRSDDPASRVAGTVFEVTDAELLLVDAYEAPFSYRRVVATLASGRQAWVYVHLA